MEIPDGYGEVRLFFTGVGLPLGAQCTLGVDVTTYASGLSGLPAEVAADYEASNIDAQQANTMALSGVELKVGPIETGPTFNWSGIVAGDAEAGATSPQVCYLIHKQTAFGGRSGRGRMYLPGVTEGGVNPAGVILASIVTDLTTAVENFRERAETDLRPYVLLHNAGAPLSTPTIIESMVCDSQSATQRRRNRR